MFDIPTHMVSEGNWRRKGENRLKITYFFFYRTMTGKDEPKGEFESNKDPKD